MSDQDKTRAGGGPPGPPPAAGSIGGSAPKSPEVVSRPGDPTVVASGTGGMAQPPLKGRTIIGVAANQFGLNPRDQPRPPTSTAAGTPPPGSTPAVLQPQTVPPPVASTMHARPRPRTVLGRAP